MKHDHRILPGHRGGEYTEGNVISVEVTNCDRHTANHVMWHYANWCLWGKEEDLLAYKGLSGYCGKEDIIKQKVILGGRISGEKLKESGFIQELGRVYGKMAMSPGGWLYENRVEYSQKGYEKGIGKAENRLTSEQLSELAKKTWREGKGIAALSPEQRKEAGLKGGMASGLLYKERKTGVCGIPPEEHSKRMSETNRQKWCCPECGFTGCARKVNEHMLSTHGLGKNSKVKVLN